MSRPASAAGSNHAQTQSQKTQSLAPSNISLFVSNLRLLNLNRRSDWPVISVQDYDTKDALQNQKRRISCTEWALFRLFELWDRETTRDKLQPFFPPLEPLQSLNLRSALFRCLNELKKNDVLGREAVLRKTMLDECKGEKFEEILLLFSAVVVRKHVLSTRRKQPVSIVKRIATTQALSKDDMKSFLPLALVHRASLAKTLRDRAEYMSAIDDFRKTMQERQETYRKRRLKVSDAPRKDSVSSLTSAAIQREIHQNWVGNTDGFDTLIDGSKASTSDSFIGIGFDSLWQHFCQGTTPKVASGDISLLESLQIRVSEQNMRLHRWREYQSRFDTTLEAGELNRSKENPADQQLPAGFGWILFDRHQNIRLDQSDAEPMDPLTSDTSTQYEDIVMQMNQGLARVRKEKQERRDGASLKTKGITRGRNGHTKARSEHMPVPVYLAGLKEPKNDLFSPLKRLPAGLEYSSPMASSDQARQWKTDSPLVKDRLRMEPYQESYQEYYGQPPEEPLKEPYKEPYTRNTGSAASMQSITKNYTPATSSQSSSRIQTPAAEPMSSLGHVLDHLNLNDPSSVDESDPGSHQPEEAEEDEAPQHAKHYESAPASSPPAPSPDTTSNPSPLVIEKPRRPTLAERTRMSMAFTSTENLHRLPEPLLPPTSHPQPTPTNDTTTFDRRTSLADRAKLSMTLAQSSTELQRKRERPRSSIFPVNQFQTPKKGVVKKKDTETTPKDRLFGEDAEYASVFRSRPRVAHSPLMSPEDEDEGLDLDLQLPDIDDESFDMGSSPLKGR